MEYFIFGLGLAFSPCVLPILPILTREIHGNPHKYKLLALYLWCVAVTAIAGSLLIQLFPSVIIALSSKLDIVLVVAGLLFLDFLTVPNSIGQVKSALAACILLPLTAGTCILPAFLLALSTSTPAFNLTMCLIGLNLPIIVMCLLPKLPNFKIVSWGMSKIKRIIGMLLLCAGLGLIPAKGFAVEPETQVYIFTAKWCSTCQLLEKSDIIDKEKVIFVDGTIATPEIKSMWKEYKVKYLPTIIILKDGKVKDRTEGIPSVKFLKKWKIYNE